MKTMNNNVENNVQNSPDLDVLVEKLKKRDEKQKTTYRRFYIMMTVFVIFYFLLMVANPDPYLTFYKRIAGLCYVSAFLIGAFIFRREHRMMVSINYADPLLKVLKSAAERYRPFNKRSLPMLLVLLFIDLGISFGGPLSYLPDNWSLTKKVLIIQAIYWGIMGISALIGYLLMRRRYKPLWLALKRMIDELDLKED